jgi:hypothetical protein
MSNHTKPAGADRQAFETPHGAAKYSTVLLAEQNTHKSANMGKKTSIGGKRFSTCTDPSPVLPQMPTTPTRAPTWPTSGSPTAITIAPTLSPTRLATLGSSSVRPSASPSSALTFSPAPTEAVSNGSYALYTSGEICQGSELLVGTYTGVAQCFIACSTYPDPPATFFSFGGSGSACYCYNHDSTCALISGARRQLPENHIIMTYRVVVPAPKSSPDQVSAAPTEVRGGEQARGHARPCAACKTLGRALRVSLPRPWRTYLSIHIRPSISPSIHPSHATDDRHPRRPRRPAPLLLRLRRPRPTPRRHQAGARPRVHRLRPPPRRLVHPA